MSQASQDIVLAEIKGSCPLLQNVFTTLRGQKKEREQDIKQCWRPTASHFSATVGEKTETKATKTIASTPDGPFVSWTLTDHQAHCRGPSSGLLFITISTRKTSSPLKQQGQSQASSCAFSIVKNDKASSHSTVTYTCSATMVKVIEYRLKYESDQKTSASQLSVTTRPTFSSSIHVEVSSQSPSSTFYLYKSLSHPLCGPQSVYRSSLFLSINKSSLSSSLKKPQEARHLPKSCKQNIRVCNRAVEKTHHLSMAVVKSRNSGGNRSSDSMVQLANMSQLPFVTRCNSSSEVVGVNENANDVSGTLRSNQRGNDKGPGKSGVSVRISSTGTVSCSHTEIIPGSQECVVSFHLLKSCTCGSNSTDQLQLLSLKEALQLFRPDFIHRSQRRVHRLEQRARERRGLQPANSIILFQTTNKRQRCTRPHSLSDNLFKPKDREISGKEMQVRSRRIYNKLPEVTKKKEDERRRLVLQTNRLRADVFKKVVMTSAGNQLQEIERNKHQAFELIPDDTTEFAGKLLDQILQRNID